MNISPNVSFEDVWKRFSYYPENGAFKKKDVMPFIKNQAPAMNQGFGDTLHFSWATPNELKSHYKTLFNQYKSTHPFIPSKTALRNPATLMIAKEKWARKCREEIIKQEPKFFGGKMLYTDMYGQKADTKPRDNHKLGSTWVRGLRIISPNEVDINLGPSKKNPSGWYTYRCTKVQQARLMKLKSIGREIAKARRGASSNISSI